MFTFPAIQFSAPAVRETFGCWTVWKVSKSAVLRFVGLSCQTALHTVPWTDLVVEALENLRSLRSGPGFSAV